MNKLRAKVKVKQRKNVGNLIRQFFKYEHSEKSIEVRGQNIKLEIFCRESPIEVVDVIIEQCEIIELDYGKSLKEYEKDKSTQVVLDIDYIRQESEVKEKSEQTKQESQESKNTEQPKQENEEKENSEQPKQQSEEIENSEQTEQECEEKENSEQTKQESQESKNTEQPKQENEEKENFEQTKQQSEDIENSEQTGKTRKKNVRPPAKKKESTETVPELKEIAKKATSFDNFAELIAKWLEMDKRQEFFKELIIVSAHLDKITWKEVEKALNERNILYTQWDKIRSSQQVSKKFKERSVTTLSLLKLIAEYKGYSFKQKEEKSEKENSTEQSIEEPTENVEANSEEANKTVFSRPRVKMECMPEIKDFEENLASVDKTQPVEERVRYVLEAMKLSELTAMEQKQIVQIASAAVKKRRMDFDIILAETKIPIEQKMIARMTFSTFINDFVHKYESDRKVKVLTFLSELQKIIMFESEIEN